MKSGKMKKTIVAASMATTLLFGTAAYAEKVEPNQEVTEETETTQENDSSELQKQIDALKEEISALKSENEALKKENEELKNNGDKEGETEAVTEATTDGEQQEATEYTDTTTIRIVQQTLNDAGYNCGNPDGVAGSKTIEAVTKYQTDKGLAVNGKVTDELLKSLGVEEQVQDAIQKEASKGEYGSDYTYDQLARNPDTYNGEKIKISGKVLQAETGGDICYARIAMNNDYNTVVFVTYDSDLLNYRLLDDDQVTVYGTSLGIYSYEAVSGATITIPWLNADIIEM